MRGVLLAAALLLASCGKSGNGVKGPKVDFAHGALPAGWVATAVDGMQAAWYSEAHGATLGLSAHCEEVDDTSQAALVQQELVGLGRKTILSQTTRTVDGREAEDWVVKGRVDGVEVTVELVVFRRGKCVYDLNLVSRPATFEAARVDFQTFLAGFVVRNP